MTGSKSGKKAYTVAAPTCKSNGTRDVLPQFSVDGRIDVLTRQGSDSVGRRLNGYRIGFELTT